MKKLLTPRKFSLLGLVLLGASAVTAAIVPANNSSSRFDERGSLTASDDNVGQVSCTPTVAITPGESCNVTADSIETNLPFVLQSASNQTTDD